MLEITQSFLSITWSIFLDAGFWVIVSLIAGGYLHVCVPPDSFKKWFGQSTFRSIGLATGLGMLLPICSCGVVPLGLSLYWSGASLAATLAFMAATPIINPAAALMAFGLFGSHLASVYVLSGFFIPLVLAYASRLFTPSLQFAPGFSPQDPKAFKVLVPLGGRPFGMTPAAPEPLKKARTAQELSLLFLRQSHKALRWGFLDMGLSVSKYILYGILCAAIIFTLVPQWFVAHYLGEPGLLSYGGSVLLGTVMYVCSVGHIPVVAALMAMGASPGVAVTFLLSGIATNLPELIAMSRLLKLRVAVLYALGLITCSVLVGMLVTLVLPAGFTPVYTVDESKTVITLARSLEISPPYGVSVISALVVCALGIWSAGSSFYACLLRRRRAKRGQHAQ